MPTKYVVNIGPIAEKDLEEIWSYIAADSPQAAAAFMDELFQQLRTLQTFPLRCPLIAENEDLGASYRHLLFGEYRTIFRVDVDTVEVLRVIHGARLMDISDLELI